MSQPFIHDRFLLETEVAIDLYEGTAKDLPIVDYHCHLPPDQMAENHRFRSITEVWLEGDHYKWRAMRANGIPEKRITGDASDRDKFQAWAETVPETLRNPLFHWTHMELKRPFGVEEILSPTTADRIFDRCNERLAEAGFTTLGLLEGFKVAVVCTTDDPTDTLAAHEQLALRPSPVTEVYPTWRPDKAIGFEDPAAWNAWVERLEKAAATSIGGFEAFLDALDRRHAAFHAQGCRASDHGLEAMPAEPYTDAEVKAAFDAVRSGRALDAGASLRLKSAVLHRLALLDHQRGWVQQFHLGALRNNNTRYRKLIGADAGLDSIGDFEQARPLARFLDRLDETDQLAKTILYNLNPRDNELLATMAGNFQGGGVAGKMQFGSAWWFLDQLDGMEKQMNALSNMGLLSRFVGMITDSRSFLSYSRHDYFRRLLCNLLGHDVRRGLVPDDRPLLRRLVKNVCCENASTYFGFGLGRAAERAA